MVESLRLALAPSSASSNNNVALQPLSQRLHRLWTERGDFSKFSLADLHDEDGGVDEDDAKSQGEDAEDEEGRRIAIGWAPGEEDGAAAEQTEKAAEGDGPGSSSLDTKPMSMEDFVALKEEMIGKLSIAQQSLYSSQALVSLLVAGHRSRTSLLQSSHLDPSSSKATPSNAASRAPSPGAASSTGSDGGRGTPAAQRNQPVAGQGPPPGSAAAVEAEFGLEPASVALTAIDRVEVKKKKPQPGEEDDEEVVAERERVDPASNLVFASDAERDEYARRTQLVLAQKRQTMRSVVDILRAGARLLDDSPGQDEEAATSAAAAESSSASRQHWAALREAQARGWGITPGRPGKSQYHAQQRRADEGEQDAWIGFAVPEARTAYARRGLAYVARDDAGRKEHGEESPEKGREAEAAASNPMASSSAVKLIFPSRVSKRFRVSLVTLDPNTGTTLRRSVSSLSRTSDDDDHASGGSAIDVQLRQTQRELTDRELFDDVAAEARLLASQGIVACESKDDSVLVKLAGEAGTGTQSSGGQLAMLLEMVDESSASSEEGNDDQAGTSTAEPASPSHYVALLDSIMRLGLVRRYQQRALAAAAAAKAEAEAANSKDKGRNNAPPSSAGGKASRPTTSQPDSTAGAAAAAGKRPKLDPWTHAPTLMPLIALLHYASFLFQVRSVVQGALNGNKEKVDLKGELEMHPAQSIANAAVWLREVLDPVVGQRGDGAVGSSSQGGAGGAEAAAMATRRAIASLRGSATVTIEVPDSPTSDAPAPPPAADSSPSTPTKRIVIAHLTLSYPSHLSVQLPWRTTLSGQLGVTMHGVDVQGGGVGAGGERTLRGLLEEEIREVVKRQGGRGASNGGQ